MSAAAEDGRFLRLDGCFHVRDVGGRPTEDGQLVGSGRVLRGRRASPPQRLWEEHLDRLGLATVIDLRTADERWRTTWQPPPR
jgi:protein tyrosine/serine phosphatase